MISTRPREAPTRSRASWPIVTRAPCLATATTEAWSSSSTESSVTVILRLHHQGRSVVRVRECLTIGTESFYLVARAAFQRYLTQDPTDEAGELERVSGTAEEGYLWYPWHGA